MVNAILNDRGVPRARRSSAALLTLNGIEPDDWRARGAARKLAASLLEHGQVACWVEKAVGEPEGKRGGDQRVEARECVRLRSAKVLDSAFRFMCECRICDRSRGGLRLALARDVPLPRRLVVHIDESAEVRWAKVVWRRGRLVGIRLYEQSPRIKPCDRYALRARYYGILD
jgi:hypothetical protein